MTTTSVTESRPVVWTQGPVFWSLLLVAGALIAVIFFGPLREMVRVWDSSDEYGYGYMIPALTAFLIWQRKDRIERIPFEGSWLGIVVLLAGVGLFFVGSIATLYVISQYGFLLVVTGVALSLAGRRGFKPLLVPLLFLVFMIPLPVFLYNSLSAKLQLISSELGVAVIRLFGISVFLQGNVIDLGTYKLQVVEACSGLRYLFPLASLSFIAAYFYNAPFWKRAVIVLSSAPITILMNSFRIGVIGVLVEHWGTSQAEGFLHDFEGWIVFMACILVLVAEMMVLNMIGSERQPLREVFGIDLPQKTPADALAKRRPIPRPAIGSVAVLIVALLIAVTLDKRAEVVPQRTEFAAFPLEIEGWRGTRSRIDQIYLDILKLEDYFIADYVTDTGTVPVNFYVAYYTSQRSGEAVHSPRSCIPGGGWEISELSQRAIAGAEIGGRPIAVNRAVIRQGDNAQLVYYWFQQRGRPITSEYGVKWYILVDALTRNRTDGALVRLVTPVSQGNFEDADRRLEAFVKLAGPRLDAYVPN
jgi:exosortase D (VPLPA-CTERM-specific)